MKLTDEDFMKIVKHIKDNYGINLIQKRLLIEGRLGFTVMEKGFVCYKDYIDYILKDTESEDYRIFLNKLTTNHTYFMREQEHFEFFIKTVLPHIENTVKDRDVRIWSAGCSFGNEPYNLAMYIDEYFGERKSSWDLKILATDISSKALLAAKEGIYKVADLNDIPPHWLDKYFIKVDSQNYQICDKIRKEVAFKYLNLMEDFNHKKPFDLILCRNVMIYFDAVTKDRLVDKFFDETKDDGYLFIGHAENLSKNCKYHLIKPSIFQKV